MMGSHPSTATLTFTALTWRDEAGLRCALPGEVCERTATVRGSYQGAFRAFEPVVYPLCREHAGQWATDCANPADDDWLGNVCESVQPSYDAGHPTGEYITITPSPLMLEVIRRVMADQRTAPAEDDGASCPDGCDQHDHDQDGDWPEDAGVCDSCGAGAVGESHAADCERMAGLV